jgi:serine/threonine protein kinase
VTLESAVVWWTRRLKLDRRVVQHTWLPRESIPKSPSTIFVQVRSRNYTHHFNRHNHRFTIIFLILDVWSLGITLVELATGAYPYKDCKTDFEVLTKVLDSDPPSLPDDQGFSEDFKDFIKRCLTKDYKQRPKYNQLLEHPFLKNTQDPQKLVNVSSWFHAVTKEAGIILPTQDMPLLTASHLNR